MEAKLSPAERTKALNALLHPLHQLSLIQYHPPESAPLPQRLPLITLFLALPPIRKPPRNRHPIHRRPLLLPHPPHPQRHPRRPRNPLHMIIRRRHDHEPERADPRHVAHHPRCRVRDQLGGIRDGEESRELTGDYARSEGRERDASDRGEGFDDEFVALEGLRGVGGVDDGDREVEVLVVDCGGEGGVGAGRGYGLLVAVWVGLLVAERARAPRSRGRRDGFGGVEVEGLGDG